MIDLYKSDIKNLFRYIDILLDENRKLKKENLDLENNLRIIKDELKKIEDGKIWMIIKKYFLIRDLFFNFFKRNSVSNKEVFDKKKNKELILKKQIGLSKKNLKKIKIDENYYKKLKISIIVLNYNNKNIITKCIDRLIKFNNYNYEIIVVDNGSIDGSYEILKHKYFLKNKIRLFKNSKNGVASGFNYGAKKAIGNILVFFDSDLLVYKKNWLDISLICLLNFNYAAVSYFGGWYFDKFENQITYCDFKIKEFKKDIIVLNNVDYLGSGSLTIKREIFEKIGKFDEAFDPFSFEDLDLSIRLKKSSYKIGFIVENNYLKHLMHQTSSFINNLNSIYEKNLKILKEKYD